MPYLFNNKVAVTKDELVPHFFKSENTLYSNIQRYKDKPYGIKRIMIGGHGRQMLIDLDTLPQEIKQAIPDPRKCDHILERYYRVDGDAVRFFSLFRFDDGTYLKNHLQEKYIVNASMLRAVIMLRDERMAERRNKTGKLTGIGQTLVADAISFNKTLLAKHHVEHTLPTSWARFNEDLKAFEMPLIYNGEQYPYNYQSVISGRNRNINSRKVDDNTWKLLQNLFVDKTRKPTPTEVHKTYEAFLAGYIEVINNKTGEVYDPKDFKNLSPATVNKYLTEWSSKIATHQLRSDNRQWKMGNFKPYYSFEMPKLAGSIVSIDDRQPPFKTLEGKRIWFYLGVDIASRAITCFVYGESKEGIIMEFYRQLVRNYAIWGIQLPAELECEMSLNSSFTDTFLREGTMFEYVKMEANNARGKYIERVNEELRYRKEKKHEGWLARPNARKEANQSGTDTEKVKKLPYSQIIELCLREIEDWNNEPHPTQTEMSRWEYFENRQNPDLNATNYKSFIQHIGIRTETSCKLGNIQLDNGLVLIGDERGQVAKGDTLIRHMTAIEGKAIEAYWLDDNGGGILKAYAYLNGEYVCELVSKPRPNRARKERTEADRLAESILAAYTNTVDSYAKRQMQDVDTVITIDNRPRPERKFRIAELDRLRHTDYSEERETVMVPSADFEETDHTDSYSTTRKSLKDRF